jgi:hypothetical protein
MLCALTRGGGTAAAVPPAARPRSALQLARPPHVVRRRPAAPRAVLWSLPGDVAGALRAGAALGAALGVALSALPILTGDARERNEARAVAGDPGDAADNVRWGVMGLLSAVPFLNPLAWVFAALDDEVSAPLYWAFAALYTVPYVASGLELDTPAVLALAACIAHVQIERIAATEAAEVELPAAARAALRALPGAAAAAARAGARVAGSVADRTAAARGAQRRRPDRKALEERSREARAQLEEFDERRRARERERQERQ